MIPSARGTMPVFLAFLGLGFASVSEGRTIRLRVRRHPEVHGLSRDVVSGIFSTASTLLSEACSRSRACKIVLEAEFGKNTREDRVPVLQGVGRLLPSAFVEPEEARAFVESESVIDEKRGRIGLPTLPLSVYLVGEIRACEPPKPGEREHTLYENPGGCAKVHGRMILLALRSRARGTRERAWFSEEAALLSHELGHVLGLDHKEGCDEKEIAIQEHCEDIPEACKNLMNRVLAARCPLTIDSVQCGVFGCPAAASGPKAASMTGLQTKADFEKPGTYEAHRQLAACDCVACPAPRTEGAVFVLDFPAGRDILGLCLWPPALILVRPMRFRFPAPTTGESGQGHLSQMSESTSAASPMANGRTSSDISGGRIV